MTEQDKKDLINYINKWNLERCRKFLDNYFLLDVFEQKRQNNWHNVQKLRQIIIDKLN